MSFRVVSRRTDFLDLKIDPSQEAYKQDKNHDWNNTSTCNNYNRHHHLLDDEAYPHNSTGMAVEATSKVVHHHPTSDTNMANGHSHEHNGETWTPSACQDLDVMALKKKKKKQRYERLLQVSSEWIAELEDVKWTLQQTSMRNAIVLDFMAMQGLDESPQEAAAVAAMIQQVSRM